MNPPNQQSREDSYKKLGDFLKRVSKPKGGFRSIGDDLSGHEASMITFGVKAAAERDPEVKKPAD